MKKPETKAKTNKRAPGGEWSSPYPYTDCLLSIQGPQQGFCEPLRPSRATRLDSIVAPEIDRVLASDGRVLRSVFRNRGARLRYGIHARSGAGDRQRRSKLLTQRLGQEAREIRRLKIRFRNATTQRSDYQSRMQRFENPEDSRAQETFVDLRIRGCKY